MDVSDDAEAKAQQLASLEGLTLLRSANAAGFKWVSYDHKGKNCARPYVARTTGARIGAAQFNLGSFVSAAEAALAIARHLGPDASREAAKHRGRVPHVSSRADSDFGVSRNPQRRTLQRPPELTVAAVAVDAEELGDEEMPEQSSSAHGLVVESEVVTSTARGKRKHPMAASAATL